MSKKQIKYFGFIGLGMMGQRMLANMSAHKNFRVVAAWDPNSKLMEILAKKYPDLKISNTQDAVIYAKNVDAIYVASPPQSHTEYVLSTIKAQKVIFCEKPLGINVSESSNLVNTVEKSGLKNAVNFPFAGSNAVNFMKQELANGAVGQVKEVNLRCNFSSWPRVGQQAAKWLCYRDEGGVIREVVSHFIFLIERLFGPATLIDASITYPRDNTLCETKFIAKLRCENINISFAGGIGDVGTDSVEFTIWGTKTSFRLYDWYHLLSSDGDRWHPQLTETIDPRNDCYINTLNELNAMIEGKPHNLSSLREALSVQKIIEKILNS